MKVLKNLMLALGVLGLSVSGAKAAAEFDEVINSSWTVYVVSVASDPATQVDSASIVMENRKVVELQNLDTSANMYCLHRSSVTATGLGKKIAAGASWVVAMRARDNDGARLSFYCVNDSGTGPKNMAVIQARSK